MTMIKVSYSLAKFGGHRHCGSENITILVSHVILQDHVIKELSLDGQEPIKLNYHLSKFGGHRHSGCEEIMILVCHVISKKFHHVMIGACDFIGGSPSR